MGRDIDLRHMYSEADMQRQKRKHASVCAQREKIGIELARLRRVEEKATAFLLSEWRGDENVENKARELRAALASGGGEEGPERIPEPKGE